MDGATIIAIISVSGSVLSGCIVSLFHSLSLSRCVLIDCLCFKCERDVLSENTYREEQNEERNNNHENV
jgi:hypothetical protein